MLKTKFLIEVFDFLAKVNALNVVVAHIGVHRSHRYLYLPSEPHHHRVQRGINKWAYEAFLLGKPAIGVKGMALLYRFLSIYQIPIDYMHAILESVVNAFLHSWLNHSYSDFFLEKLLKRILISIC